MRLFVALEIPEVLRQALAERLQPLRRTLPPARWTAAAGQHLTLRFLGETDVSCLVDLGAALAAACAPLAPFPLTLGGAGAFPPRGPVRVLWSGIDDPEQALGQLKTRIDEAVETVLGLPGEGRPFHPHVTLARCRKPWPRGGLDPLLEAFEQPLPAATFTATETTLFESDLQPGGAVYRAVGTYPLTGGS